MLESDANEKWCVFVCVCKRENAREKPTNGILHAGANIPQ